MVSVRAVQGKGRLSGEGQRHDQTAKNPAHFDLDQGAGFWIDYIVKYQSLLQKSFFALLF
jgi:hypothetical protein